MSQQGVLLQSAHSATGALSALGWISAAGRSAGRRCETDECYSSIETAFSQYDFCGKCVQLLTGFLAARGSGGDSRSMGGRRGPGPNGSDLSRNVVGRGAREYRATQANLPDVQRLHDGASERPALRMLPAGQYYKISELA